jgi:hypothetical protein
VGSNRHLQAAVGNLKHIPLADTLEWMYQSQLSA